MTDAIYPVRAWPTWDERTGYAYLVQDGSSRNGEWKCTTIPLGATGVVMDLWSIDSLVEVIQHATEFGTLRSIKILMSNQTEIKLESYERVVWGMSVDIPRFDALWDHEVIGRWDFVDGQDAEAVARAVSEAVAWIERQGNER